MARKFGIEMEFSSNDTMAAIENGMASKGLEVRNVGGYGHSNGHYWELKTDSSATHQNHGRGYEIASRVLEGDEGLKEIEWYAKAMNNLRSAHGLKVNRKCGIHFHVDISDFSEQQFKNLVLLVMYFEPVLWGINPPSRRENQYCRPVQGNDGFEYLAGMRGPCTPEQIRRILEGQSGSSYNRYFGLNITRYLTYGRIEFRYGGASLNPKKILGWVSVLLAIVEKAKTMQRCRLDPKDNTKTLEQRKNELRKLIGGLRREGLTHKVSTAPSVLDERFNTFSEATADQVPAYGRG